MRRAAAIVCLMSLTATAGVVYRSVDSQGHVQYSDTPVPGAELVHVQDLHGAPAAPAAKATSTAPSTAGAERALQSDLEQVRAEQCKKAQDNYQQALEARRVYRPGADGERVYLSDEEADQVRLNKRLEMESVCNGG